MAIESIRTFGKQGEYIMFTERDSAGFTATVTLSREELAKLVQAMDGGTLRSRFSTYMQPDTCLLSAAGAYLARHGYGVGVIVEMSEWERIWLAESMGWDRKTIESVNF